MGLRPQCELCMLRIKIDKVYVPEAKLTRRGYGVIKHEKQLDISGESS